MHTSIALECSPTEAAKALIVFEGARVARSAYNAKPRTLSVRGSLIDSICMPVVGELPRLPEEEVAIDLSGFLVLPGLINAHDHLDYSLFPRMGQGPYQNWREWAADIHRPGAPAIEEQMRVPREARYWWGGIRNLLSGVTTVSQHDRYLPQVFDDHFPVHVPHEYGWVHSLTDLPQVVERFHQTSPDWPFIIHLAEGTDETSQKELDILESLLPLDERIVIVHGVGLTPKQWERVTQTGAGIVWCPSSNLYTLGKTLSVDQIRDLPNVALATDSPLTANHDLLDEIQFAHRELRAPAPLLYDLVTTRAARLLRLRGGEGALQAGSRANLIAMRDPQVTPAEALVQSSWRDIELVMERGRIVLLSASLAARIPAEMKQGMEWIFVDGVERLLRAPVQELSEQTRHHLGRMPDIGARKLTLDGDAGAPWLCI